MLAMHPYDLATLDHVCMQIGKDTEAVHVCNLVKLRLTTFNVLAVDRRHSTHTLLWPLLWFWASFLRC